MAKKKKNNDIAISVQNVTKEFTIYEDKSYFLKERYKIRQWHLSEQLLFYAVYLSEYPFKFYDFWNQNAASIQRGYVYRQEKVR